MALGTRAGIVGHIVTRNCLWLFLVTTMLTVSVISGGKGVSEPEFSDPIKNISTVVFSHVVDFSCHVRNLGGNRIMWIKKESEKPETLLAIGSLKITQNPRISVSLLQSSGDLSSSILYIYNIAKEDDGVYHCIVNTSPIIVQVGTLEVKDGPETVQPQFNPRPTTILRSPETRKPFQQNLTNNDSSDNKEDENSNKEMEGSKNESHDTQGQSSDFCIDLNKIWRETKYSFEYLFSWVVHKIQNIV